MRVLQINTTYKTGGSTGRIVFDLHQTMQKRQIESFVTYGYTYKKEEEDNKIYQIESIFDLKVNILKTRIFGKHGFYNYFVTKKLLEKISEIKPDVIHLHNIHNHYINASLLFSYIKKNNIPVVWTLHDCWAFTGWCAYFDYSGCSKWETGCHTCSSLHDYPFTWFFDRSRELYNEKKQLFCGVKNLTIVSPSEWLARLVSNSFLKEYPLKVINNGIDLSKFTYRESEFHKKYNLTGKKIVLAVANNFSKRKGVDFLLRLPWLLPTDYKLVLLGINKENLNNLPNNCIGILKTTNIDDLVATYSAADVFINPTLEDNFPTTNIEALACGTPCVTYITGGSHEIIDEKVGLAVIKNDEKEFVDAIKTIVNKGKQMYFNACISKAQDLYNKELKYGEYIELYKKIFGT